MGVVHRASSVGVDGWARGRLTKRSSGRGILLGLAVHAGMLAAVAVAVAGLTRPESSDLRCGGAAACVAMALGRLE